MSDSVTQSKLLTSVSMVFAGMLANAVFAFLAQATLARAMPMDDYGYISTAVSIAMIVAAFANFGIPAFWLQIFGKHGWSAYEWAPFCLRFLLFFVPSLLTVFWCIALVICEDPSLLRILAWMPPLIIAQVLVELLLAKFQLESRYVRLSIWQQVQQATRFSIALLALFVISSDAVSIAKSFAFSSVLVAVGAAYSLRSLTRESFRLDHPASREEPLDRISLGVLVQLAWPFAATAGLVMLYGRIEVVLLGVRDPAAAAKFAVVVAFLGAAYLVPHAIFQGFLLPKMYRWYYSDRDLFNSVYQNAIRSMAVIGLAGSLATYLIAEAVVVAIFGESYRLAGVVLAYLAPCIFCRFITICVGSTLVSTANIRRKFFCQVLTTVMAVIIGLILIARFGLYGAVISKLVTEITLCGTYILVSKKYVFNVTPNTSRASRAS